MFKWFFVCNFKSLASNKDQAVMNRDKRQRLAIGQAVVTDTHAIIFVVKYSNIKFYSTSKMHGDRSGPTIMVELCAVHSKCECCSASSGEFEEFPVECTLETPGGPIVTDRTAYIFRITVCECKPCNGSCSFVRQIQRWDSTEWCIKCPEFVSLLFCVS